MVSHKQVGRDEEGVEQVTLLPFSLFLSLSTVFLYIALFVFGWWIFLLFTAQGHIPPILSAAEEDEGEGLRAHFPLSFGRRQDRNQEGSLEAIHSATKRKDAASSSSLNDRFATSSAEKNEEPQRRRVHGPLPMHPLPKQQEILLETSAPKALSLDDDLMVGPPLPPTLDPSESDGEEIGPPPPGPNAGTSTDDDDADTDDDDYTIDDDEEAFKVPMSNEIVLKGHSKVLLAYDKSMCFSILELFN